MTVPPWWIGDLAVPILTLVGAFLAARGTVRASAANAEKEKELALMEREKPSYELLDNRVGKLETRLEDVEADLEEEKHLSRVSLSFLDGWGRYLDTGAPRHVPDKVPDVLRPFVDSDMWERLAAKARGGTL